ncbi:hypothetical protein Tco_1227258 [Tanacetum coccineum]
MEDSLAGERNHHMVHKLEVIGQRIRVIGLNVLEESSKKHGIRESHFTTLGYTYHSMSNVVGKIEGLPIGEDEDGTNLFVNVKKAIEANCRKGVAKIRFIFEKVGKDDTTFMEEASHERLVDLPFMTGEASGTVIHGDVVESSDDDLDKEDATKQGRTSDKTKPMSKDSDFDDLVNEGMAFVQEKDAENQGKIGADDTKAVNTAGEGTLIKMKEEKANEKRVAKEKGVVIDQGLAQIKCDAELAQRLHEEELAELDRAQKEKQKQEEATNAALAEEFDEIQDTMDANHELAVRLTHEEQEKYIIKERATLLAEYFERRKKQLEIERAEEIRNKPPTRAQTLEELQKLYQKEQKWINDFKPMDSEEDGSNTKKAGKRIKRITYSTKKEELRMWLAVVPNEDETLDPEILSVKYPIVDWESQNLGSVDMEDIHVYKIIRAYGNTSYHKTFSSMLRKLIDKT